MKQDSSPDKAACRNDSPRKGPSPQQHADIPLLAKISPPRQGKVYLRKQLFRQLDKALQQPITWLSAPGGFGKTTLIASYLKERQLSDLWYQLDAGDRDLASFFYYLSLAGQHVALQNGNSLPLLTPENMPALPVFARNFFRQLFSSLKAPAAVIFDNYQDIPTDALFHQIFAEALQEVPEGIRVVVVSRQPPPACFSRLQVNQSLVVFDTQMLALSLAETKGLIRYLGYKKMPLQAVDALCQRFSGWCAGILLQLNQGENSLNGEQPELQKTPAAVFDYLATQGFEQLASEEQEILLKSALLPHMSAAMLTALTSSPDSQRLLAELYRQNYFITRYSNDPSVFQFHDLFRDFLLEVGQRFFPADQLRGLKKQAAQLLLAEHELEEAAQLFAEAGEFDAILQLTLQNAPQLFEQGRLQLLQSLLGKLPVANRKIPWVIYWEATVLLPVDLFASRQRYEQALAAFEQAQQLEGMFLSWAGIVDTFIIAWDNFQPLGRWIDWMDEKLCDNPGFPNPMVEARVVFGMFCSLIYHQPHHPDMRIWVERVDALLEFLPDDNRRIALAAHYALYLGWVGELKKAGMLFERLRPAATLGSVQPLNLIAWQQAEAMYHWLIADFEASDKYLQDGLELAKKSGIHLFDFILLAQRVYTRLDTATAEQRQQLLQDVLAIMDENGTARQAHYYYIAALDAQLLRDPQRALVHAEKSLTAIADIGLPFSHALNCIAIGRIQTELESFAKAADFLRQGRTIAEGMNSSILQFSVGLAGAELCFAQEDETAGKAALAEALSLGRSKDYLHFDWWRPYAMRELCLKALQYDIEVEYVQDLIRQRQLLPKSSPLHLENWPWRIRIYTLGRFSVVLDGKSIHLASNGQKKPLELLTVLIALGGREVRELSLNEILWPDTDGDVAHSSFTTTLSRLRKLLCNDALIMRDGCLSLNDQLCWLDTWTFERQLGELDMLLNESSTEVKKIEQTMHKAIALYKGAFLNNQADESWVLGFRERLRLKLLRTLKRLINYYGQLKKCDQVICLYDKALELDQFNEEYYRGLMRCHAGLGDRAKALAVYENCQKLLKETFAIDPAGKTTRLFQQLNSNGQTDICRICQRPS